MADVNNRMSATDVHRVTRKDDIELPQCKFFQTYLIRNVDKAMSPNDLKMHLLFDISRWPYVSVLMPVDSQGETTGTAFVSAPKIYSLEIMQRNGSLNSIELEGRKKRLKIEPINGSYISNHKWMRNDIGMTVSCNKIQEAFELSNKREITPVYSLVDCGAYYTHERFAVKKDAEEVIERAYMSGVEKIVIKTFNIRHAHRAKQIAAKYPGVVYFTAGFDGRHVHSWKGETTLGELRSLLRDPQCVALGEISLDRSVEDRDAQIEAFTAQVSLACELSMPLMIAENEMTRKVLPILTRYSPDLPPVCVSTTGQVRKNIKQYFKLGCYISLSGAGWSSLPPGWEDDWVGTVSENNEIERLLLGSEAPDGYPQYISMVQDKRKAYLKIMYPRMVEYATEHSAVLTMKYCAGRNESLALQSIVEYIAGSAKTTPDKMAAILRRNSYEFFRFGEQDRHKSCEMIGDKALPDSKSNSENVSSTNNVSHHEESFMFSTLFLVIVSLPVVLIVLYEIVTDICIS